MEAISIGAMVAVRQSRASRAMEAVLTAHSDFAHRPALFASWSMPPARRRRAAPGPACMVRLEARLARNIGVAGLRDPSAERSPRFHGHGLPPP